MGSQLSLSGASLDAAPAYWPALARKEIERLHELRRTTFEPDTDPAHLLLLQSIWRALKPTEEFARVGQAWKDIGFQGAAVAQHVQRPQCT